MKICHSGLLPLLLASIALPGHAQDVGHSHHRGDDHAPIGVMGEHMHDKGEWMVSYRFMRMKMEDNRIGTDTVPNESQLRPNGGRYMVIPTKMDMDMHMVGAMWAPSDRVTLMAMAPFVSTSMDHLTAMGGEFTTESSGVGDLKLSALVGLGSPGGANWILNLGVSAPTGSIDEMDVTPASAPAEAQLPYPMQLGSGTWDITPGITVYELKETWSWGAQVLMTLRTGTNDRDYTLGDRLQATAWYARPFAGSWSWSVRLKYDDWDNIDGADPVLNPRMVPTADTTLRAGKRLDAGIGLNWVIPGESIDANRLALELLIPVQQDLNGPQLETKWTAILGWQLSF